MAQPQKKKKGKARLCRVGESMKKTELKYITPEMKEAMILLGMSESTLAFVERCVGEYAPEFLKYYAIKKLFGESAAESEEPVNRIDKATKLVTQIFEGLTPGDRVVLAWKLAQEHVRGVYVTGAAWTEDPYASANFELGRVYPSKTAMEEAEDPDDGSKYYYVSLNP